MSTLLAYFLQIYPIYCSDFLKLNCDSFGTKKISCHRLESISILCVLHLFLLGNVFLLERYDKLQKEYCIQLNKKIIYNISEKIQAINSFVIICQQPQCTLGCLRSYFLLWQSPWSRTEESTLNCHGIFSHSQ